ncbi:hypothetical protein [Roseovarius nanhaiticus]|uniref:Uncharacterized protein n=1 Tax=Roseovarius nanhaiticus TaxID=573024 RepID=A0A1N7G714_9RHOB|nr:hypothetical protein [Roseovarius nanhaiticus]SEK35449.1 hypothetical protein SAMN05216208_0402 [Roseovarius nanhaiticus]SIS08390.1 hypothetical protein SAMN05421666_1734 [Roseovarius nanhaiticus]
MTVTQILKGLDRMDAVGADADAAARMGFLEWAFALPGAATPEAARAALDTALDISPREAQSPAARAFVAFLSEATLHVPPPARRGRAARLH